MDSKRSPKRLSVSSNSVAKKPREEGLSELFDQAESTGACAPVVQWIRRNPFGLSFATNPLWKTKDMIARRLPVLCEKALTDSSPSSPSVEGVCDVVYELMDRGGYATEIADKFHLVESKAHDVVYKCIEGRATASSDVGSNIDTEKLDMKHLVCLLRMHEFTDHFEDYTEKQTSFWSKHYFSLLVRYSPLVYPKIGQEISHAQWEALQTWVGSFVQLLGKFVVFWGVPPQGGSTHLKDMIELGLIDIVKTSVDCILHFDKRHGLRISAKVRGDLLEEIVRVVSVLTTSILDEIEDAGGEELKAYGRQIVPILLNLLKCRVPTFQAVYSEDGKRLTSRSSASFSSPQEERQQETTWIAELFEKCDENSSLMKEAVSMLPELYAETTDLPIEERRYRFDCTASLLSQFLLRREVPEVMRKGGYRETRDLLCAVLKADGSAVNGRIAFVLFELDHAKRDVVDSATQTPLGSNFIQRLEQAVHTTREAVNAVRDAISVVRSHFPTLAIGADDAPVGKETPEATSTAGQISTDLEVGIATFEAAQTAIVAARDAVASALQYANEEQEGFSGSITATAESMIGSAETMIGSAETWNAELADIVKALAVAMDVAKDPIRSAAVALAEANAAHLALTGTVGLPVQEVEAKEKMHNEELGRMAPLGAHVLDFEAKRSYLQMRFERHRNDWQESDVLRLVVPRDNVTDGVCDALGIGTKPAGTAPKIDVPLEIEFRAGYRNEEGEEMVEEGEDQGGLRRQWLDRAARHFIESNLFCQPEDNPHRAPENKPRDLSLVGRVFSPASVPVCKMVQDDWESQFELFGCVIGFALLYKELIPVHFSHSFLKQVFCKDSSFQDHLAEVECMDKMLYQKMKYILNGEYKSFSTLEEALEFSNLPTTFAVAESHCVELIGNTELCPDGGQKKVTEENKKEFVKLFLRQYLVKSMEPQTVAFRRGLTRVVPSGKIELMSAILTVREIELMLCGTDKVDIDDWQKHTVYENGYTEDSDQIKWFWEVVRSWDLSLCLELLSFTTGSSQVPTGGFHYLQPEHFTIQRVAETNRMVEAHTCANVLDLPMFESREKLEKMLTMTLKEGGDTFGRR